MKNIFYFFLSGILILIYSCQDIEDALRRKKASDTTLTCSESFTKESGTSAQDIKITSCITDNNSITFGQSYQHQLTTTGTYQGTLSYSLSNQPSSMTISSSGLIQWTPSKASEIGTHSNISVSITTETGFILTQTYDLTVSGTCTSGNVLSIWSGDQRTSTNDSEWLGNVTAYTDNAADGDVCGRYNNEDCTAFKNYDYNTANSSSENLHIGPTPSATKGNMFFYHQYDDTDNTYLFWMFGVGGASVANKVHIDLYSTSNTASDSVIVDDDLNSNETNRESQTVSNGLYTSTFTGRYSYGSCCSDGGVLGPYAGTSYRIFIDISGISQLSSSHSTTSSEDTTASGTSGQNLGLGNLDSFTFWSKDGSSFSLGDVDNFTIGYGTSLDCSN